MVCCHLLSAVLRNYSIFAELPICLKYVLKLLRIALKIDGSASLRRSAKMELNCINGNDYDVFL